MATYRVQKRLSTGQRPGDIVHDTDFRDGVALILYERKVLSLISGPPLTELPGWTWRAELLAQVGVTMTDQFLEADDELIRQAVGYRSTRAVAKWKEEVRCWLMPAPVRRR